MSSAADPRTWVTVPGADSTVCVHIVWIQKLRRLAVGQRRHDVLDRGFGGKLDGSVTQGKPFSAQSHLRDRLLAGNVNGTLTAARVRGRDFKQQRRFADAGIAAQEQHRSAHQPAAGHAVEFGDTGGQPRRFDRLALERLDDEQPAFA
jgi:hypothetical protein